MKAIKKLLCLVLTLLLTVGLFSGCHKANEIALTIGSGSGKQEFTSAYYLCTLVSAYQEAQQKVYTAKQEAEQDTSDIDYLKEKIDGKTFTEWVENRAMEILKNYAALKQEMKANKVELSDSNIEEVESTANTYWNQYGYSELYEKNGVSYETFKKYIQSSSEDYVYFNSIYGHDGTNEVSKKEIKKYLKEHYAAVDQAYYSLTDTEGNTVEDSVKQEYIKTLNSYAKKLNAGKIKFSKVYKAVNGELQEGASYSTYVGDENTDYAIDDFEKVKKLKKHKAVVLELDGAVVLLYKQSLTDDSYEDLHESAVYNMKHDDFTADLDEIGKTLKVDKKSYAFNRLKVKNIDLSTETE